MCGSIFFRKVGRAMMKKENKKTEPDVKNNDRQKEKKSVKLGSMGSGIICHSGSCLRRSIRGSVYTKGICRTESSAKSHGVRYGGRYYRRGDESGRSGI